MPVAVDLHLEAHAAVGLGRRVRFHVVLEGRRVPSDGLAQALELVDEAPVLAATP
jgi:hypothetical protein